MSTQWFTDESCLGCLVAESALTEAEGKAWALHPPGALRPAAHALGVPAASGWAQLACEAGGAGLGRRQRVWTGLEGQVGVGTVPVQEQRKQPKRASWHQSRPPPCPCRALPPLMPGDTPRSCQVQPFAPNVGGGVPSGPWAPNQLDSVGPDLSQASLPPPPASPTHQCHVVTVTRGVQLTRHPSKGWQGAVAQAPSQRGRMPQEGRGWPFHGGGRIRSWCCCVSGPRCDPVTGSLGSSGGRRRASRICSLCRWKGSLE